MKKIILSLTLALAAPLLIFAQQGTIRGVVTDKSTGETLIGVAIRVEGGGGAITDLDGSYQIQIAPGTYSMKVEYSGYAANNISDVQVKAGEVTVLDFLMQDQTTTLVEVVITATQINNTENAIMALQKRAITVQDGISSQEITRFGSSNAADAMKRVTGASVQDGKYVVVRGLGDRYSATQLNGIPLPSTDPYRNSTQLDLIPSTLIDNVVASKTFTPNLPGNFTGGNVDIKLKDFPDNFTMDFSVNLEYNDQASFNNEFLTSEGGRTDWLGFDDGKRAFPSFLQDPNVRSELTSSLDIRARNNEALASLFDQAAKSVNPQMEPTQGNAALNHGIAFSIGDQIAIGDNALGVLVSTRYKRNFEHYSNGIFNNYDLPALNAPSLSLERDLHDIRSVDIPQIGGLASLTYKFADRNKLNFSFLYNHEGRNDSRILEGPFPQILQTGSVQTRSIQFVERGIQSYLLGGEHVFGDKEIRMEWNGGYITANQEEPDLRFFANDYRLGSAEDTSYFLTPAAYPLPYHFYRTLEDRQWIGKVDFTIPFLQRFSSANKIQFGALYQTKDRDFVEDRFQYDRANGTPPYSGNANEWFSEMNRGILSQDPNTGRYTFGLGLADVTVPGNSYSGTEAVAAGYGMITYDWRNLKVIAGARVEATDIEVVSADTLLARGNIETVDVLPSVNLIYRLNENMNLRGAYSQTLARPNMRELAPFSSFEFIGDFRYTGNPNLNRTLAQNYDLRWEWFPRAGEMVAVSAYYKVFKDPIIQVFIPEAANKDEIQFENVNEAIVYGAEFEFRKSLGFIADVLTDLRFISNFSLIYSEVSIPQNEVDVINQFNPDKGNTRPFQGQSPFLLNASLNYLNPNIGTDATLSLNVFGQRLAAASFGGRPDIYEQPRPQLDFAVKQRLNNRLSVQFYVRNILNPLFKTTMEYKGTEYIVQEYTEGRRYGVTLAYKINSIMRPL